MSCRILSNQTTKEWVDARQRAVVKAFVLELRLRFQIIKVERSGELDRAIESLSNTIPIAAITNEHKVKEFCKVECTLDFR